MRNGRRNWFLRRLVLGFAIALVVVPVAQGRPAGALPPLAHAGANTEGTYVPFVTDFPSSSFVAPEQGPLVRGDYKDGVGTSPGSVVIVGDDKGNVPLGTRYEPVQVVSNPSNGFDWGDAGIGAGTVFAVMLLGAGALLATRHVGRPASV
jgi:hypothetical protein